MSEVIGRELGTKGVGVKGLGSGESWVGLQSGGPMGGRGQGWGIYG